MIKIDREQTCLETLKVLVIEDNPEDGRALIDMLERTAIRTWWAMTGTDGLALNRAHLPDVVLVDLSLPDVNGIDIVSFLAERAEGGVIILSSFVEEADRIVGLELGADDCITKPANPRELLARIRAVYRRVRLHAEVPNTSPPWQSVQLGTSTVDRATRSLCSNNNDQTPLTSAEFSALEAMVVANGEAVSRDDLSQAALHRPCHSDDRSVDQLIFHLRHKLSAGDNPPLIHTIRGAGYLLSIPNMAECQKTSNL